MDFEPNPKPNYIRNTKTSQKRTVRIEVVGEVNATEKHFLDGVSFFVAGTLSHDNENHTSYVSQMMSKLLKHIIAKLRKQEDNYSPEDGEDKEG